jgi:hypothetical protein
MRFIIQLIAEDRTKSQSVHQIAVLERDILAADTLGLGLGEAKTLLGTLQSIMIADQVADLVRHERVCSGCGRVRPVKDHRTIAMRTLFGKLAIGSPRFRRCGCDGHGRATISPVVAALPGRVTPELLQLETRWASLASFGVTADLLSDVLPIGDAINAATIRNDVLRVAERLDGELGPEQAMFVEGCQAEWDELPIPDPPITVGIDGGYVRCARDRKTNFEVIVGKSVPEEGKARRFGFTAGFDDKPKRRLFEVLLAQGMTMNQQVTFLSDGGDTVRALQYDMNPNAEHVLDWFHIAMRLTVIGQQAKGLSKEHLALTDDILVASERVRHFLWHGNTRRAIDIMEDIEWRLDDEEDPPLETRRLLRSVKDFIGYIRANVWMIPNYGERWRNKEAISTAFVESTVNQVVSKRFAKKQQMQWSPRGAHLLLQTRTRVLDGVLERDFKRWYPRLSSSLPEIKLAA